MTGWVYWLDMAGVIVFALSGVILACRSRMDPFGMLVLAAVTGIGGGTLRDLVLGVRPVFWVSDPTYLWVILATVAVSILGFHYIHRLTRTFLPVTDAFGLALFTVIGAHKALLLGSPGVVAVLMGLMTGVAGGMIRDLLARRVPMVLRQEVYATASIAGGTVFVVLSTLQAPTAMAIGLGLAVTLGLRLAAIRWHLALPTFAWVVTEPAPPAPEPPLTPGPNDTPPTTRRRTKARVKLIRPGRRQGRR
ncbi:trimeric intracellular cation channel family protein [Halomonas sp. ML-15]|uniref:trimeric intracellular cation channel family protein n=1 Tax=Halomonas sp. ML-15 TaxID=2773305 RepID=UPI001745F07E|nr:trimeric intracellular cation channel family protein [Halomonas sp. ML-15]MBD3896552.1 trimeric intracellular cation channel family protein [Halomonas sp. ML-15]